MPSPIYNPVLDKGADYGFALVFYGSDGNPIDLSQVTLTAPIFAKEGDANSIAAITIQKDSNTLGRAIFTLSAAASAAIVPSKPYYEIWVQYPNGGVLKRYTRGTLHLDK